MSLEFGAHGLEIPHEGNELLRLIWRRHAEGVLDSLEWDVATHGDARSKGIAELAGVDFEIIVMLAQLFPHGLTSGLHQHI